MTSDHTGWRTSSYSGSQGGNGIEVADRDGRVLIRDTKNRAGAVLRLPPKTWRRFIGQVKADA